jgi:GGDEF domain-containing protein
MSVDLIPTFTNALVFQPTSAALPPAMLEWLEETGVPVNMTTSIDDLVMQALRGRPRAIVFDGRQNLGEALDACLRIKRDPYTGVIPAIFLAQGSTRETILALGVMADEVVSEASDPVEMLSRLRACLARSDRNILVHPSTRLPGSSAITQAIESRIGTSFAVCYADLDHFKEFNDRYGYTEGDRVIRIVSTLLHDTVYGMCHNEGFVGHIGGDDFIFIIPRHSIDDVCTEIITTFDQLIGYQYSEHDRRAGYFFGKDRRGNLHRVPLMTISIGVVTIDQHSSMSPADISQLATEMKTYAKTLPGSVYVVDRRVDEPQSRPLSTRPAARLGAI